MTRRAAVAVCVAGVVAAITLVTSAYGGEESVQRGVPHPAALSAVAESMDVRLTRLEQRLGLRENRDGAVTDLLARYEQLRARERAVAIRAEAALRFVPHGAPVPGGVITSTFSSGRYHPIKHRIIPHVGIDIAAVAGTPVHATADGVVSVTVNNPTYGLTIDVRHGPSGFVTRYAHLSRIGVRPGQFVRRGDEIGRVGSTGLSTGPHTHYEVFLDGWRRDPIRYMPPGGVAELELLGAD